MPVFKRHGNGEYRLASFDISVVVGYIGYEK